MLSKLSAPSYGGRIVLVVLEPLALVTTTCTWQMSLLAFSPVYTPLYTPVVGSAAHDVCFEYEAGERDLVRRLMVKRAGGIVTHRS